MVAPVLAQPLHVCVQEALEHSVDAREAAITARVGEDQVQEARARLLPSLTATAGYTRNEVEVAVQIPRGTEVVRNVITPYDQLDARATLTVPLLDIGNWLNMFAAEHGAAAGHERRAESERNVVLSTVTAYVRVLSTRELRQALQASHAAATNRQAFVQARVAAGLMNALDGARADADAARVERDIVEADLAVALAEQQLSALIGHPVGELEVPELRDTQPQSLTSYLDHIEHSSNVRAEMEAHRQAELQNDAAWAALLPTITASASERVTNAAGFGPNAIWAVGVSLQWNLDFLRGATIDLRRDQSDLAALRVQRAREREVLAITEAYHRAQAALSAVAAATRVETSSRQAQQYAASRFEAGTATHTDVSQAERDAILAVASAIEARGNLLVARANLVLRTGGQLSDVLAQEAPR